MTAVVATNGLCRRTGKLRYPGRTWAELALATAAGKGREEARVYKCRYCRDWHLTSQTKRKGKVR
jgi:hypothetical protein